MNKWVTIFLIITIGALAGCNKTPSPTLKVDVRNRNIYVSCEDYSRATWLDLIQGLSCYLFDESIDRLYIAEQFVSIAELRYCDTYDLMAVEARIRSKHYPESIVLRPSTLDQSIIDWIRNSGVHSVRVSVSDDTSLDRLLHTLRLVDSQSIFYNFSSRLIEENGLIIVEEFNIKAPGQSRPFINSWGGVRNAREGIEPVN